MVSVRDKIESARVIKRNLLPQTGFFFFGPNSTEENRQHHVWFIISKTGIFVDLIGSEQLFFAISMTHERKSG